MNVSIHLHSGWRGSPATATVDAWWADGGGLHHAYLLDRAPLDVPEGSEQVPWVLLRALFRTLADQGTASEQVPPPCP